MIDELKNIESETSDLRNFGLVVGGILCVIALYLFYYVEGTLWGYFLGTGVVLAATGVVFPAVLLPFQKVWMGLAVVLGFFVSRIILALFFYLFVTPISLVGRLSGKTFLERGGEPGVDSYWKKRDNSTESTGDYDKQY